MYICLQGSAGVLPLTYFSPLLTCTHSLDFKRLFVHRTNMAGTDSDHSASKEVSPANTGKGKDPFAEDTTTTGVTDLSTMSADKIKCKGVESRHSRGCFETWDGYMKEYGDHPHPPVAADLRGLSEWTCVQVCVSEKPMRR